MESSLSSKGSDMRSTTAKGDAARAAERRITDPADQEALPEHARRPGTDAKPTFCRTCGAVFQAGRWQWLTLADAPEGHRTRCPACLRMRAGEPAGLVTLVGGFVQGRKKELVHLIRREEEMRRRTDPQSRIMRFSRMLDRIDVATTDTDLPRRIGEAVKRAYGGTLGVFQEADGVAIRVRWLDDGVRPAPDRDWRGEAGRRGACTSVRLQRTMMARSPITARSM
jgi:hypothetical protein